MTETRDDVWAPGASNLEEEDSEKEDSELSDSELLLREPVEVAGSRGRPDPPRGTPRSTGTDLEQDGQSKKRMESTETVGWSDLPRKRQLIVLTLARLSEPLVQTSLQVIDLDLPCISLPSIQLTFSSPTCSTS